MKDDPSVYHGYYGTDIFWAYRAAIGPQRLFERGQTYSQVIFFFSFVAFCVGKGLIQRCE